MPVRDRHDRNRTRTTLHSLALAVIDKDQATDDDLRALAVLSVTAILDTLSRFDDLVEHVAAIAVKSFGGPE